MPPPPVLADEGEPQWEHAVDDVDLLGPADPDRAQADVGDDAVGHRGGASLGRAHPDRHLVPGPAQRRGEGAADLSGPDDPDPHRCSFLSRTRLLAELPSALRPLFTVALQSARHGPPPPLLRIMLTPTVTPIRHAGPSPYAPPVTQPRTTK